jgi:ribosomal protein L7Ae-like RNA K-turn-binding protein
MPRRADADPPSTAIPPERPLLDLLGLAARARALVYGTDMSRTAAREGKASAVILASDAAPTQARKLVPLLETRGIRTAVCLTREEIGGAIGRGPVSAVAITDRNFARRAIELARALSTQQDPGGELH